MGRGSDTQLEVSNKKIYNSGWITPHTLHRRITFCLVPYLKKREINTYIHNRPYIIYLFFRLTNEQNRRTLTLSGETPVVMALPHLPSAKGTAEDEAGGASKNLME